VQRQLQGVVGAELDADIEALYAACDALRFAPQSQAELAAADLVQKAEALIQRIEARRT
jgi:hypothetical protein